MLLKTSFPYTGGFLCCPNKMVRFIKRQPGFPTGCVKTTGCAGGLDC